MEAARLVRSSLLVPFGSAWSHNGSTTSKFVPFGSAWSHNGSTTSQKSPSGESGALWQQDHRGRRMVLCMSAAVHADGLSQKAALLHVQGRMTWNANMLRSEQVLQRKSCRRGAPRRDRTELFDSEPPHEPVAYMRSWHSTHGSLTFLAKRRESRAIRI